MVKSPKLSSLSMVTVSTAEVIRMGDIYTKAAKGTILETQMQIVLAHNGAIVER